MVSNTIIWWCWFSLALLLHSLSSWEFSDQLACLDNITWSAGCVSINLVAVTVHKFPMSVSGIDLSRGCVCVWKAHLLHVCRCMTQAAGQGNGNRSRGLNRILRLDVKFPSLFVYPPPFTGWLHCSEWRHAEKESKKEERNSGGGRKMGVKKKERRKELVAAVLTTLTAGRK